MTSISSTFKLIKDLSRYIHDTADFERLFTSFNVLFGAGRAQKIKVSLLLY